MSNEDRRKVFTQPREAAAWLTGHPSRMVRNDNGLLIACFAIHGHWTFRECKRPTFHVALADNDAPFVAVADEQGEIPPRLEPLDVVKMPTTIAAAVDAIGDMHGAEFRITADSLGFAVVCWALKTFEPKRKEV